MSWLYSRALMEDYENSRSLQALVEEYSAAICSDGAQSAPSSESHTPQAYLPKDKMTDFSRLSRFGMTFAPLTDDHGAELLTWYLAGFHAKTLAQPEEVQELKEKEADCGERWLGWLAKYDPNSSGWKTAQCSLLADSEECLETFPRWGMTRDGLLWERPTLAPIMSESAFGSWLATPTCTANQLAPSMMKHKGCRELAQAIMLPTPTCHNAKEGAYPAEYTRNTPTLGARVGGKIHPEFTEWMMGWPLGWTDLKPLETDKFQQWQQAHGGF